MGWWVHDRGVPSDSSSGEQTCRVVCSGVSRMDCVLGWGLDGSWLEGETLGDHRTPGLRSRVDVLEVRYC